MNNALIRQLLINTLFWTGVIGMIIAVFSQQYLLVYFFVGLVAFNILIVMILRLLAPQLFKQQDQQVIGFKVKPLDYPKVMDDNQKSYVSEFIEFDVAKNNGVVFQGKFERKTMEKLRDLINNALNMR